MVNLSDEERVRIAEFLMEVKREFSRRLDRGAFLPGADRNDALRDAQESEAYARALLHGYRPTGADVTRWCALLGGVDRESFQSGADGDLEFARCRELLHRLRQIKPAAEARTPAIESTDWNHAPHDPVRTDESGASLREERNGLPVSSWMNDAGR